MYVRQIEIAAPLLGSRWARITALSAKELVEQNPIRSAVTVAATVVEG
jgi:hypothetical protein